MSRTSAGFVILAGLNGLIAVVAGAWAAHGFVVPLVDGGKALADAGSHYQMWHALALLGVGLVRERADGGRAIFGLAGIAFVIGIAGFSGGLYAAAVGAPIPDIAPFGGTVLMVGWLLLALAGGVALVQRRPPTGAS